jgi:hypothetical protein
MSREQKYLEYLDQDQRGFIKKDVETEAIACGLVALYDGLSVSKFLGIGEKSNKRAWVEAVKAIITSIG